MFGLILMVFFALVDRAAFLSSGQQNFRKDFDERNATVNIFQEAIWKLAERN